ncbi:hypothetical protein ACIGNX_31375 [Actinosynnema sp. NPDC053489]|uniref:hypothetical protein n=1 Tax=Actinosynnema sp. NPDC053489 TaxID=3363916 RepID=UPI0037C94A43
MDKVVVSVADDRLADLPTVVAALRDAGMVVDAVLAALGVVTGSVAPGAGDRLGAVPGVAHVEVERTLRPPPEPGG